MPYKQVKAFSLSKAGEEPLECLRNVRKGYEISARYGTAKEAWDHTQQHKSKDIPAGLAVPLFYSYKVNGEDEGHVNVRLPNNKVWSDGTTYDSLADYLNHHYPKYLGWGESLNGVRVLEAVKNPVVYYTVKSGDTLGKIAEKYHTSVKQLVAWNKSKYPTLAKNANLIKVGWKLRVR